MTRPECHKERSAEHGAAAIMSSRLDANLLAYAAAATAAGVSLLALTQPAEAKVVYTKADSEIAPSKMLNLDLNHHGITDFLFSNHFYQGSSSLKNELSVAPQGKNGVLSSAAVLDSGAQIGPKRKFQTGTQQLVKLSVICSHTTQGGNTCRTQTFGQWVNITSGYLGLRFFIRGHVHYGWARLNVTLTEEGIYALLTGYAYETN